MQKRKTHKRKSREVGQQSESIGVFTEQGGNNPPVDPYRGDDKGGPMESGRGKND